MIPPIAVVHGDKGDRCRFSGIISFSPLLRVYAYLNNNEIASSLCAHILWDFLLLLLQKIKNRSESPPVPDFYTI
jgi:hypothetical protein